MSGLQTLIKDRIDALNMQMHSSIVDYMVVEKYISAGNVAEIYDEIVRMDTTLDKESVIFEIAAFNIGLISEETLIDIITNFRGEEVVQKEEMSQMEISNEIFSQEMCAKYSFFEYKCDSSSDTKYMVCSFTTYNTVSNLIKRSIEDFRIRYSIPSIIFEKLNA